MKNPFARLVREHRRLLLSKALAGDGMDRWRYAVSRVSMSSFEKLMAYGSATADSGKDALRATRIYCRLERLAQARNSASVPGAEGHAPA